MTYTHGINLTKQDSQEAIRRLQQEQEPCIPIFDCGH